MAVAECGRGRYTGTSPIVTSCSQGVARWAQQCSDTTAVPLTLGATLFGANAREGWHTVKSQSFSFQIWT